LRPANIAKYWIVGPQTPSAKTFDASWLDLNLPVPNAPLPPFHDSPKDSVYAWNEDYAARLPRNGAYWAWSLAGKNPEPFVM
jgi:hypothetical protein